MAFFRRDKSQQATPEDVADETTPQAAPGDGPWDRADISDPGDRLDLGGLLVPGLPGMEMRLELDQTTGDVVACSCHIEGSALQLQAFAAPKTLGIWDDIRDEIAAGIESAGGSATIVDGRFGTELEVEMPSGPGQFAPARFLGVDGPRWFLRGFISGDAATDDEAAAPLREVFADTVVVRGDQAMAPRELLPLRLPQEAMLDEGDTPAGPRSTDDLLPFERGPEITEIN